MVDTMLLACVDTPSQAVDDRTKQSVPSMRKQALFLDVIPVPTALGKMRRLKQKRSIIRGGLPSKKDWLLISSKRGKGLKVKDSFFSPEA